MCCLCVSVLGHLLQEGGDGFHVGQHCLWGCCCLLLYHCLELLCVQSSFYQCTPSTYLILFVFLLVFTSTTTTSLIVYKPLYTCFRPACCYLLSLFALIPIFLDTKQYSCCGEVCFAHSGGCVGGVSDPVANNSVSVWWALYLSPCERSRPRNSYDRCGRFHRRFLLIQR